MKEPMTKIATKDENNKALELLATPNLLKDETDSLLNIINSYEFQIPIESNNFQILND